MTLHTSFVLCKQITLIYRALTTLKLEGEEVSSVIQTLSVAHIKGNNVQFADKFNYQYRYVHWI